MQNEERLITFGDLLRIKREAKDLTIQEAEKQIKVSTLSAYEKGKYKPGNKNLSKLISFYKISEAEMASLKISETRVEVKSSARLTSLIKELGEIIQKVAHLPDQGLLAKNLKKDGLEQLKMAHECMTNVIIIDRLL